MRRLFKIKLYLKCMMFISVFTFLLQSACFAIGGYGVINDSTPPVITLSGSAALDHEVGTVYNDKGATATDNIDGDISDYIVVYNPVDVNVPGKYVIKYNVQDDAGNDAVEMKRTVNVKDTAPVIVDSDGDGYADSEDVFPSDPDEWIDSDSDGVGDNGDSDDDNDGMPDTWELEYGLNPLKNDAALDADNDGFTNLEEFTAGTDPTLPLDDVADNQSPEMPELYLPVDDAVNVELQPELMTLGFSDPDADDRHFKTKWQISIDSDFSTLVLDRETKIHLVSVVVPKFVLENNTQYFWRVKFFDNHQAESDWSETYSFTTLNSHSNDANGNGIPDNQEVDSSSDLDQDGFPDIIQKGIKSLKNKRTQTRMAISEVTNDAVVECVEMVSMDHVIDDTLGMAPFGFVGFTVFTQTPGDEVTVKILFSKKIHSSAIWYKYDEISGMMDYSDHTFISEDRMSVIVELKDGGYGDADGVENGVIVDPGGMYASIASMDDTGGTIDTTALKESISEGMAANCFISNIENSSASIPMIILLFMAGIFAAGRVIWIKKNK